MIFNNLKNCFHWLDHNNCGTASSNLKLCLQNFYIWAWFESNTIWSWISLKNLYYKLICLMKMDNAFWVSVSLQKSFEFVELNLSRAIFVYLLYKFLNINCHLEFFFDGSYKLWGINTTFSVWLTAHCHESLKHFCFIWST